MDAATFRDLEILWRYMRLDMEPAPADVIAGFGCYDETIPLRAAELYRQGLAPLVVFSGSLGRHTAGLFQTSEAARFAAIAVRAGVPAEAIVLEERSANTGENLLFTRELLAGRGLTAPRVLGIHKPYMERRLFAAAPVYWPEARFRVTSPRTDILGHIQSARQAGMTERAVVETVVGDVQRIELYAQKGYQTPQTIPAEVRSAYARLAAAGYTGQLART